MKKSKQKNDLREKAVRSVPSRIAGLDRTDVLIGVVLVAACLVIYWQVFGFDFVNLDDNLYVYENPFVTNGLNATNIAWAWTSFHATNWHPVTWMSHQLDASLFGINAGSFHAVNLFIHAVNSILVFVVLKKLTGRRWESAAAAMIFAVHPTHVESVAWISERKDVLSALFWLAATWGYSAYIAEPGKKGLYWLSVILFALGLAAKPMLVTLPFTLILLDHWPLRRFEKWNASSLIPLVKEKWPFFLLSAGSVLMTILAQGRGGAIQSTNIISFSDRLVNAIVSYARYVEMFFFPTNLGAWYPFDPDLGAARLAVSAFLLIVITAASIWQINRRKYLFVGWMWFLGTLVPVIGILQVGRQALADRYTYIPYIGLSILVVWALAEAASYFKLPKAVLAAAAVIVFTAFTVVAFKQTSHWKNTETLSRHTLEVTKDNYFIESNYCNYLEKQNRLDEASAQCNAAIEHDPTLAQAYNTLGTVQIKQGKLDDARRNFQKTIELAPEYALPYANLAIVETNAKNIDEAEQYLDRAVAVDKNGFFDTKRRSDAYMSIGNAAMQQKQYDRAANAFQKALAATPNNVDLQRNLALSLHLQGRSDDAIKILEGASRKNPNSPEVFNTLGLILAETGRRQEAAQQFQRALQINPNFTPAQNNLKKLME